MKLSLTVLFLAITLAPLHAQRQNKKGGLMKQKDVVGNLRAELVTLPESASSEFERLNPKVWVYHPVKTSSEKVPLVFSLHGSGGGSKDIESAKWSGDVKRFIQKAEDQYDARFVVPQSSGTWEPENLDKMLDYLLATYDDIDTNRIYCVGYSMGGKGTWEWARQSPDRFAAVIPKAFIPEYESLEPMVKLPIWAIVGDKDSKPRVEGIPKMGKEMEALGSKVIRITVIEGANHASTGGHIREFEDYYDWLFSHKRVE